MSAILAGQTLSTRPAGVSPPALVAPRPCTFRAHTSANTPTDPTEPIALPPPSSPAATRRATGSLVIDSPFAAVPEWVIDSPISDTALRLYCVLLRYGNTTGHRMPSRATLAARLHKKSSDTIDRALRELEHLGALVVEHRSTGTGRALTNRYHLLTARPGAAGTASRPAREPRPRGRIPAAAGKPEEVLLPAGTPPAGDTDSRIPAAPTGRTAAARVAAQTVQDREPSTQTPPHPNPSTSLSRDGSGGQPEPDEAEARLLEACRITDLRALIGQLHDHRRRLARPITPWSRRRVLAALDAAVTHHGWPPTDTVRALLTVAADRTTTSPMRLTAPGPWWNVVSTQTAGAPPTPAPAPRPEPLVVARGAELARAALRRDAHQSADALAPQPGRRQRPPSPAGSSTPTAATAASPPPQVPHCSRPGT